MEACLVLLTATLDNLHEELERQLGDYYQVGVRGVRTGCGKGMRPTAHGHEGKCAGSRWGTGGLSSTVKCNTAQRHFCEMGAEAAAAGCGWAGGEDFQGMMHAASRAGVQELASNGKAFG